MKTKHLILVRLMRNACEKNMSQFEFGRLSNISLGVLKVLQDYGAVMSFTHVDCDEPSVYFIKLNFTKSSRRIFKNLKIISRRRKQAFVDVPQLIKVNKRFGGSRDLIILSTDKGVMTSREALEKNVGGEVLLATSVGLIKFLKSLGSIE